MKKEETKDHEPDKITKGCIIVICVAGFFLLIGLINSASQNSSNNSLNQQKNDSEDVSKETIVLIDFSKMTQDQIQTWCTDNEITCDFSSDYSTTVGKGGFISQSVEAKKIAYKGDTVKIVYSLGREPTIEERNALIKAEEYSSLEYMSKKAIYEQLISEYGEQFDKEAAQYAIDNLSVDWNKNALEKAKEYQKTLNMSKKAIYEQLVSKYGEQFLPSEAQYAIDHLND